MIEHRLQRTVMVVAILCLLAAAASNAVEPAADQYNFAEALFIQMDYASAVEEYRTFLQDYPEAAPAAAARYRIGDCFFRLQEFSKAAAVYEEALHKAPNHAAAMLAHYNLGRAYTRLDQPQQALAAFQRAAKADQPELRAEALLGCGEMQIQLQDYVLAAEAYQEFLQQFPESARAADALYSLGWAQLKLHRHAAAAQHLQRLQQQYPDYGQQAKVVLALSDCHTALGEYEQADVALAALQAKPELAAEVQIRRAWNAYRAGDKPQAAKLFRAFAEQHPDSTMRAAALFNAGVAAFEIAAYQPAETDFALLVTDYPDDSRAPAARYWRGLSLFNLGKHQQAAAMLQPLVAAPEQLEVTQRPTLLAVSAQALAQTGAIDLAITQFRQYRDTYPEHDQWAQTAYMFATVLEQHGKLPAATALLRQLVEQQPQAAVYPDALFALSEFLYRQQQPEQALPYLQKLLEAGTAAPNTLYRLGWVHFDLKNWQASLTTFSKLAAAESPFRQEALYMAGRAAEQLDDSTRRAVEFYTQVATADTASEFQQKALYRLCFLTTPQQAEQFFQQYRQGYPEGEHRHELALRMADNAFAAGQSKAAQSQYAALVSAAAVPAAVQRNAAYGLAWCQLKQGDLDAAQQGFAELASREDSTPAVRDDAVLQQAEIAYRRGELQAARDQFAAVAKSPNVGARALYMLGWCHRKLDNHEEAAANFRQLLDANADHELAADARLRLAQQYNRLGKPAQARDCLAAVMNNAPDAVSEDVLHTYADALTALQDWQGLLATAERQVKQFPESPQAYLAAFRQGLAYQGLGIADQAEAAFRQTIAKTETIEAAQAQFNLGAICFSREEYLDAAKNFLRVEMLYDYPELAPKALYHAVQAFRRAGNDQRAQLYQQKLRTDYRDSEWAQKAEPNAQ